MKTHYPVSDELREAVDDFFGNAEVVYATPGTDNHSANFYGDTHVCELTKQDVFNLIQIADSDWTAIDEDGLTIRSINEAEATETILSELQHDKPE